MKLLTENNSIINEIDNGFCLEHLKKEFDNISDNSNKSIKLV